MKNKLYGFETDTVWGLGCLPNDSESVDAIYEIKGRDRSKPLILMSNDIKYLLPYVKNIPDYANNLMQKHFPGALTLIFEKTDLCPDSITAGNNTVGIRIPNHKGFWNLCKSLNKHILATTSLNYSNHPPVSNYEEAYKLFSDKITIIKPEYECKKGVASTVVLCTKEEPIILRKGHINI